MSGFFEEYLKAMPLGHDVILHCMQLKKPTRKTKVSEREERVHLGIWEKGRKG